MADRRVPHARGLVHREDRTVSWPSSLLIALLTGALGLLAAGLVMSACVIWYRISSFEGEAGFAVVGMSLLGGMVGVVLGLVVARLLPGGSSLAFFKALGAAWGIVVLLSALAAWIAHALADIPPTIAGRELDLEIEIRLPVDEKPPSGSSAEESTIELGSLSGRVQRVGERGELRFADARLEDGRWIVPASVSLFTARGRRLISFQIGDRPLEGFILHLPARPGRAHLEWSEWQPTPVSLESGSPDSMTWFRFRVIQVEPEPAPPTRDELLAEEAARAQERFEAVDPHAPVVDWIEWTRYGTTDEQKRTALERIAARETLAEEMRALMLAGDARTAEEALRLVEHLPIPALVAPVTEVGRDLVARLQAVNQLSADEDPACESADDVSRRFSAWMVVVRTLREHCGGDFTPELGEILVLSRVRSDCQVLRRDVVRVASYYMHSWTGLEPLPTDPRPR